jgi:hypothetical protein
MSSSGFQSAAAAILVSSEKQKAKGVRRVVVAQNSPVDQDFHIIKLNTLLGALLLR